MDRERLEEEDVERMNENKSKNILEEAAEKNQKITKIKIRLRICVIGNRILHKKQLKKILGNCMV